MRLSGEFEIMSSIERVSSILDDPFFMERCVPFVTQWSVMGDGRVRAVFSIEASGEPLVAEVVITVKRRGERVFSYTFEGSIKGARYEGEVVVRLEEAREGATIVFWEAVLDIGALVGALDEVVDVEELIKMVAKEAIKSFASCSSRGEVGAA